MAGVRVHIVMDADLLARVDAALPEGGSRGAFVRRAVEQALEDWHGVDRPVGRGPAGGLPSEGKGSRFDPDDLSEAGLPAPAEQSSRRHAENCKCPVCS